MYKHTNRCAACFAIVGVICFFVLCVVETHDEAAARVKDRIAAYQK